MTFNYWLRTSSGKNRVVNEDGAEAFVKNDTMFLMISDGFGVSDDEKDKGKVNAGLLSISLVKKYIESYYIYPGEESLKLIMSQAIYHANEVIRQYRFINPSEYQNYGCSFTLVAISSDGKMHSAHMGITRLYLLRNNEIYQGTRDDNEATELLEKRLITEEAFITHEGRTVLTKALGFEDDCFVGITTIQLYPQDILVLLSDGVYRSLGNPRIQALIYEAGELEQACNWLVDGAIELNTPDNATAVMSYIM